MKKFKFYEVDKSYVSFLQKNESKIPNISYSANDKFICGILFKINNMNYYAPISSFTKQQKSNILIKNNSNRITSSIRLSFMFPVPDEMLKVKDFSKEETKYRRLLIEELDYCNRKTDVIIDKAKHIYEIVTNGKDEFMQKNCCNFKLLETKCLEYCKLHNLTQSLEIFENKKEINLPIAKKMNLDNCYFMEVNISDLKKLDGLNYEKRINKKNPEKVIIAIDKSEIEIFKNALKPLSNNNGLIR